MFFQNQQEKSLKPNLLYGKHDKPELKELLNKYDIAKNSFWRLCTRYFQSGMKPYSLLDKKSFGVNKGKTYQYTNKPGQKSKYVESNIYLDEQTLSRFEEALNSGTTKDFS